MKYVHKQKVMHRDLKLENIILDSENNVKICDFGWCSVFTNEKKFFNFLLSLIYIEQLSVEPMNIWHQKYFLAYLMMNL